MEVFVGEVPPNDVDAIDHYFAWSDDMVRAPGRPGTPALMAWASDCSRLLERFGGSQRILEGREPLAETIHGNGAYIIIDKALGTDRIEEIMDVICRSAHQHSLMFIDTLSSTVSMPHA